MKKTFVAFLLCCLLPACSPSEAERIRAEQEGLRDLRILCAQALAREDVAAKLQVSEPKIEIIKDSYDRFKSISLKIKVKNISPEPISRVRYCLVLRNPQGQIAHMESIIAEPQSYGPGEAKIHIFHVPAVRYSLMMFQKSLGGQGYSARCEVDSMDYADRQVITGFNYLGGSLNSWYALEEIGSSEKEPFALMGSRDNTCSYKGRVVKPVKSSKEISSVKEAELKAQWQELTAMRQAARDKAAAMLQVVKASARLHPNYDGRNPPVFITVRNGLDKPIHGPVWKMTFYDGEALVFTLDKAWTRWQVDGGKTEEAAYTQAEGSYPLGRGELFKAANTVKIELVSFTYEGKKIDREGGELVPEIFRREWQ